MEDITRDDYDALLVKEFRLSLLEKFIEQEDKQAEKDGYKHASLDTSFLRTILGMDAYERV